MPTRHKSSASMPILIGIFLLLIMLAQVIVLLASTRVMSPTINKSTSRKEIPSATLNPQIYQLEIVENRIRLTPKTINTKLTSVEDAIEEALNKLLSDSSFFDPISTIPKQTRLLNFHTSTAGIYINLSQEFSQGGGSSSMIYRVAQVLYTATSIDHEALVYLSIEGIPINEKYPLGGEGLLLRYPLTRQQFNQDFLTP